jgi:hypothetical protein
MGISFDVLARMSPSDELRVRRKREAGKEEFDQRHSIRSKVLEVDDLVLLHNSARERDMSRQAKMAFRWLGSYRILEANHQRGAFRLKELDGTPLQGTVAGNRIKKFYLRSDDDLGDDATIPVYPRPSIDAAEFDRDPDLEDPEPDFSLVGDELGEMEQRQDEEEMGDSDDIMMMEAPQVEEEIFEEYTEAPRRFRGVCL